MKRKWIPPFLMLFAGAVVSIVMYRVQYQFKTMLLILFAVLAGFYIVGCLVKFMLDTFDRQNREKAAEEETVDIGVTEEGEEGQVKQEV